MAKPEIRLKGFEGEWEIIPFSSFATLRRGLTYSPSDLRIKGVRVLRSSNIVDDTFVISKDDVFVRKDCVGIELAKEGDILITAANGSPKLVGKHCIIKNNDKEPLVHGGFMLLASSKEPYFLNASMSSSWFVTFQKTGVAGGNGAIGNLSKSELEVYNFFIPKDKNERNAIAEYFKSLDSMLQSTTKKIESLKQMKQACLVSMFPQAGETTPRVRFKGFEGEWNYLSMSDIFMERHDISTIMERLPQLSFTIEEGVIRPEDRKTNKRDFLIKDKSNKKYLVTRLDDIIYNPANVIYGAIHKNSLCDGVVSPIYKIFYTQQDPSFMECVVRRPEFIQEMTIYMEGTVQKLRTLKPEAFLRMSAYIAPSLEEQKKIGNYFRTLDKQISLQEKRLEKLKQIKAACLDKMFV